MGHVRGCVQPEGTLGPRKVKGRPGDGTLSKVSPFIISLLLKKIILYVGKIGGTVCSAFSGGTAACAVCFCKPGGFSFSAFLHTSLHEGKGRERCDVLMGKSERRPAVAIGYCMLCGWDIAEPGGVCEPHLLLC